MSGPLPGVGSRIDPEVLAELSAIAEGEACELLHAEFRGGSLRLVLDHPQGVDLGHCERVSKQASAYLDAVDFGRGKYTLEVSSPGLDRPLYSPRDYERFTGSLVKVTFREPETGGRKTIVGRLQGFDGSSATIVETLGKKRGDREHRLPLETIESARLEIDL